MFTITSSVLGKPQNPEGVKQAIDKLIASRNPSAPKVGEIYVRYGLKFGIRPEFAVAQSILETGWYRFGGQVRPEWHNPAGLKGKMGGFLVFYDWDEGIHAHYERLSCYVRPKPVAGEGTCDPLSNPAECPNGNCHWRYARILAKGYRPNTPLGIASLWLGDIPKEEEAKARTYAGNIVNIANEIIKLTPVTRPATPIESIVSAVKDWRVMGLLIAGIGVLLILRSVSEK